MGHTPGPWEVRNPPAPGHLLAVIAPQYRKECDANHVVCELRPWQRPDPDPDARLIAAAPELLAACKLAVRWLKAMTNDVDAETDLIDIQEAIAKAEGEDRC